MSIVDTYLENAGGNFLSVKNCPSGTVLTISKVFLDEETFDKPGIVCEGTVDGEETSARLSASNVKRIVETLGSDDKKWIGKQIQCLGHMDYPGLGKKGLLWGGAGGTAAPVAPVETVQSIIVKIKKGTDLKVKEIKALIDKEVKEADTLLDEISCAQIVAASLLKEE